VANSNLEREQGFGARIRERARELGFHAVGFARAEPLDEDHERYRAFVAAGMHGDMAYLADHAEVRRRVDGPGILSGAKTVICLTRRYDRGEAERRDPPLAQAVARYARGRDYHGFVRKRLGRLAAFVRELSPGVQARALCDTAPLLERAWAARAGLGFIGKNGLVIVPGQGSYCLLGEVVTTLALEGGSYGQAASERCGSCRACLDACPTDAFPEPFVLDPRRCVSYVTIESRSEPPVELHHALGEHLFGCDACQQSCPYNIVAPPPTSDTEPFQPLERWSQLSLEELVGADEERWATLSRGTPLRRATRVGLARNALLVAARRLSAGDASARAVLEAGLSHDDSSVRSLAGELMA
jgi:epoxyqueuosine reductase